ncbi:MAG TPA: radical SAM protein [Elusimicrobiota bacterium]|nr:radical SAM protein [Elusimicrobiota bacterium]
MTDPRSLALDHAQSERVFAGSGRGEVRRVEIHLGTLCNNLCPFCMSGFSRDKKDPWASFERVQRELRHFREKGCRGVGFLGGEPTVYPRIVDAVAYAKSLGYTMISVCTNGTRLSNPEFCRALVEAGLTRVTLSVHSHIPEVEDLIITRVPGNLSRKIAALKNLAALREKGALAGGISVNPVLCRPNLGGMEGFIRFFDGLGADDVRFNYIWPEGGTRDDRAWIPSFREAMPEILRILLLNEKRLKKHLTFGAVPRCALALTGVSDELLEYLSAKYLDESRFDTGNDVSLATHESDDSRFVWQENKRDVLKTKFPDCAGCAHEAGCEGAWKSYVRIYGIDEFRPLKAAPSEGKKP